MPSLHGATAWLNSEPLGPAELRGRVVLIDFWTLTCINVAEFATSLFGFEQACRRLTIGLDEAQARLLALAVGS